MGCCKIEYYGNTDKGNVKTVNQDKILGEISNKEETVALFAVMDGMGGYDKGEIASEIVYNNLKNWWGEILDIGENQELTNAMISVTLDRIIERSNRDIIDFSRVNGIKSGTTVSLLFIVGNRYVIKHVGDSRIYLCKKKMKKLTEDHSWVEEQVRNGKLKKSDVQNHPSRHILTNCLGINDVFKVFTRKGSIKSGDTFMLCTDGMYKKVREDEVLLSLKSCDSLKQSVHELIELVKSRGERDNISNIFVKVVGKKRENIWNRG